MSTRLWAGATSATRDEQQSSEEHEAVQTKVGTSPAVPLTAQCTLSSARWRRAYSYTDGGHEVPVPCQRRRTTESACVDDRAERQAQWQTYLRFEVPLGRVEVCGLGVTMLDQTDPCKAAAQHLKTMELLLVF